MKKLLVKNKIIYFSIILFINLHVSEIYAYDGVFYKLYQQIKEVLHLNNRVDLNSLTSLKKEAYEMEKKWIFKKVQIEIWKGDDFNPPNSNSYTHELNFSIVLVNDAKWTKDDIKNELRILAETFGKECGIKLGEIKFYYVVTNALWPNEYQIIGVHDSSSEKLIENFPMSKMHKPVVTFVWEIFKNVDGFSGPEEGVKLEKFDPIFVNTAFVAYSAKGEPYSVLAHELIHILINTGEHISPLSDTSYNERDIMSGVGTERRNIIDKRTCQKMREFAYVTKIDKEKKVETSAKAISDNSASTQKQPVVTPLSSINNAAEK